MRRTSSGSRTGFGPGAARMMRWMRSRPGSRGRRVNWVLDLDFRDYFSSLDHQWLERFLEHRIADRRVLRLIQKWLAAGVIENGSWTAFDEGVPQGASASPLLANIYAHYVFDLWAHQWRRRHARGEVVIVRFADDAVVAFEHQDDAERFWADLRDRLAEFNLELQCREDAIDRVREVRCRSDERRVALASLRRSVFSASRTSAGRRGSGRFKLKRITDSKRVPAKLQRAQGRDRATPASAHSRAGTLACQRPARALQLLRGARQQRGATRLPRQARPALVPALRRRSQRTT